MEYLSRVLKQMSALPNFVYHPKCKETKMTHLAFVDDLMIFCKATNTVVERVNEALDHFSSVTGLVANKDKSSIYIAGVKEAKSAITSTNWFCPWNFPMIYL